MNCTVYADGTPPFEDFCGSSYVQEYECFFFGNTTAQGGIFASPVIGDVNGDGDLEITAGLVNADENQFYIWNHDGTLFDGNGDGTPDWPRSVIKVNTAQKMNIYSSSLADLDHDGDLEIIAGSIYYFYVWNHDGTLFDGNGDGTPDWPRSLCLNTQGAFCGYDNPNVFLRSTMGIAVGDVNNDGEHEIVVLTFPSDNDGSNRASSLVHVFTKDGREIPGFPLELPAYTWFIAISPALGDIDNDGYLEIVAPAETSSPVGIVTTDYGADMLIIRYNGSYFWPRDFREFIEENNVTRDNGQGALLADLDGDCILEIIGSGGHDNPLTGGIGGRAYGWHSNGSLIMGFPKILPSDPVYSLFAIHDLDGDGSMDLSGQSNDNAVGVAYSLDLARPYEPGRTAWGMFQHDLRRTGVFEPVGCNALQCVDSDGDGFNWTLYSLVQSCGIRDCNDSDPLISVPQMCLRYKDACGGTENYSSCEACSSLPTLPPRTVFCEDGVDDDCDGFDEICLGPPLLTVFSPMNTTYTDVRVPIDMVAVNASSCWYLLNGLQTTIPCNANLSLTLPKGNYLLTLFANNSRGVVQEAFNISVNITRRYLVKYDEFLGRGGTSDLLSLSDADLEDVSLILDLPGYGRIGFLERINLTQHADALGLIDLDAGANISWNRIEVDSLRFSGLNKPARLALENLSFSRPRILRDGVLCNAPDCILEMYSSGTFVFNVSGFSLYTIEETLETAPQGNTPPGSGGGGGGSFLDPFRKAVPPALSNASRENRTFVEPFSEENLSFIPENASEERATRIQQSKEISLNVFWFLAILAVTFLLVWAILRFVSWMKNRRSLREWGVRLD